MSQSVEPHDLNETGYIVAWRSKKKFEAGKYLEDVMTLGEAQEKAASLSAGDPGKTFWAEPKPQPVEPH